MHEKTLSGSQLIEESFCCEHLIITPDAVLTAPEGKYLVLTVNAATLAVAPGDYLGDVTLSVADYYVEAPYPSVNRSAPINLETAICVVDNELQMEKCVPAAVHGGPVSGRSASCFYIGADRDNFAGLIVDGDSDYTISEAEIELDGCGLNDFVGMGAGVAGLGNARITINNSDIHLSSVTRCAVHAGGKSVITVNNSRLSNRSPDAELGSWSWGISVRGTNRLCQLADDAEVHYNNCILTGNGWGILSVDGSNYAKMFVKDSVLTMTGPRSHGYGVFCIGPTPIELDHTTIDVNGFPIMMMSMERKGSVTLKNNSLLTGRRYGMYLTSDGGGRVLIQDSAIVSEKAAICAKDSNTVLDLKNVEMEAGNGVLLQMMDTDDPGLAGTFIDISMYETMEDQYIPGRDLTIADPLKDLILNVYESDLEGNLFNSSTNLPAKASKQPPEGIPKRPGLVPPGRLAGSIPGGDGALPPMPAGDPGKPGGPGEPNGPGPMMGGAPGPKNLGVNLYNASLTGAISAAKQHYREGLTYIEETIREELSNVAQEPAPAINNGVIVTLNEGSVWAARGTSYLTCLRIDADSRLIGSLTVNGTEVSPAPGTYSGAIIVEEC